MSTVAIMIDSLIEKLSKKNALFNDLKDLDEDSKKLAVSIFAVLTNDKEVLKIMQGR